MRKRCRLLAAWLLLPLLTSCGAAVRPSVGSGAPARAPIVSAGAVRQPAFAAEGMELLAQKGHMAFYADLATSAFALEDLRNGRIWYSNPVDGDEDEYAQGIYRNWVHSQVAVTTVVPETNTIRTRVSYVSATKRDGMTVTQTPDGMDVVYNFVKEGFSIPVSYRLLEDGFSVEVDTSRIVETGEERIYNIKLLPMFGAQGLDKDGFLLVPSGSGGMIRFNNQRGETTLPYRLKLYGSDPVNPAESRQNFQESQILPLLGMSVAGEGGFLILADSGAANAYANGMTSKQQTAYNAAYFDFDTRISQDVIIGDPRDWEHKEVVTHEEGAIQAGVIGVRYCLLDDTQNSLAGMADVLRSYIRAGMEEPAQLPDEAPVFLSILAGAKKETSVLGFPARVTQSLTTLEDADAMLEDFRQAGISSIWAVYQQWSSSQMDGKILTELDVNAKLGDADAIARLSEKLASWGGCFSLGTNFLRYTKAGNGVSLNGDSIRDLNNAPAEQPYYPKDVFYPAEDGGTGRVLNAGGAGKALQSFLEAKNRLAPQAGIAIGDLGNLLASDYGQAGLRRQDTERYFRELLAGAAEGSRLVGEASNLYALYALSAVYNLPDTATEFAVVDESVPFLQMALHSLMPYGSRPINAAGSPEELFLTCIATGMAPTYELIYEMPASMRGLDQQSYYGADYTRWRDVIVEQYARYAEVYEKTGKSAITGYETRDDGLIETRYANGWKTLVNLSGAAVAADGLTVPAKDFLLVKGGSAE